ncbi:MAG: hypothetical protein R6W93_05340 [Candidatus Limnocylindrales bacterium]
MRCSAAVAVTLGCVLLTGTAAAASDDASPTDPNARRDEVVALVLAQDERFTSLPDYERQRIKQQSQFSFDPIIGSGYYQVLPTATTRWSDSVGMDLFAFRQPRNWLVEVVLVRDCVPMATGTVVEPLPDPCAWRHAWYYRVESDDTVTLLFEEGVPDPMPTG